MVAAGKGNVVAMPKGAITVEELERNQIASTPKLPSLPSSSGPCFLQDLIKFE